jgi:hypothetical protein
MQGVTKLRRRCSGNRGGSALYIAVLSTALIVSLLGLAGLTIVRIERRRVSTTNDILVARMNARSAVQLALRRIADDPNWQTTYSNGVETTPESLGPNAAGTLSWILEDSDGSLTDVDTHLRLRGLGRVGNAVQVSSVQLEVRPQPLSCLEVAACSNGPITFWSSSTETTNQIIHSNSSVTKNSGTTVNSAVEAVGIITGSGTINGTATTPVPAREVPTASVFDHYIANGTAISLSSLPKVGGKYSITDTVLSPANNPFGPTNPSGIYVIDCGATTIYIRNARIIGTLVLINPRAGSKIEGDVSWEPAVVNYPALLVQGGFNIEFGAVGLLDEAACGVNFNPPGSPYQGSTDSDQNDSYPRLNQGHRVRLRGSDRYCQPSAD